MPTLAARSIKVTLVLDALAARDALAPVQRIERRISFTIEVAGRTLTADFAPRAVRKCFAVLAEHGAENVAVILQGKLMRDDTIAEAGLLAQPKTAKAATEAA